MENTGQGRVGEKEEQTEREVTLFFGPRSSPVLFFLRICLPLFSSPFGPSNSLLKRSSSLSLFPFPFNLSPPFLPLPFFFFLYVLLPSRYPFSLQSVSFLSTPSTFLLIRPSSPFLSLFLSVFLLPFYPFLFYSSYTSFFPLLIPIPFSLSVPSAPKPKRVICYPCIQRCQDYLLWICNFLRECHCLPCEPLSGRGELLGGLISCPSACDVRTWRRRD